MKTIATAGGIGALATAATAGLPALSMFALLLIFAICAMCWVVTNQVRTANMVAIIAASRGHLATAEPDNESEAEIAQARDAERRTVRVSPIR